MAYGPITLAIIAYNLAAGHVWRTTFAPHFPEAWEKMREAAQWRHDLVVDAFYGPRQ